MEEGDFQRLGFSISFFLLSFLKELFSFRVVLYTFFRIDFFFEAFSLVSLVLRECDSEFPDHL